MTAMAVIEIILLNLNKAIKKIKAHDPPS